MRVAQSNLPAALQLGAYPIDDVEFALEAWSRRHGVGDEAPARP
jgi:hypothetical protein